MEAKIIVVGLGFGDQDSLALRTLQTLKGEGTVFLRTSKIPVADWLTEQGISFTSFDNVYETEDDFSSVYQEIARRLLEAASRKPPVVYAVPGHPMVAERTVSLLLEKEAEHKVAVDVRGGSSSFLDAIFCRLQIEPIEGFQLVNGTGFSPGSIDPKNHVLVGQVYSRFVASEVKLTLMDIYPYDHTVKIATACGIEGMEQITSVPLHELDHKELFSDFTSVYVPPLKNDADFYSRFDYLVEVIRLLRSPEGCPWEHKQQSPSR